MGHPVGVVKSEESDVAVARLTLLPSLFVVSTLVVRLVHQLAGEVGVLVGAGVGLLLQVGAGGVAAFDDLVVEEGLVELFHAWRRTCGRGRGRRGRPWWW